MIPKRPHRRVDELRCPHCQACCREKGQGRRHQSIASQDHVIHLLYDEVSWESLINILWSGTGLGSSHVLLNIYSQNFCDSENSVDLVVQVARFVYLMPFL